MKEGDLPATNTEEQSTLEASLEVVNEEAAIEAAIAEAEDADDADAARKAKAEAKVEEEEEDDDDDQPRFKAIQKLLAPIQCYGVQYLESHVLDQDVMEELEQTRVRNHTDYTEFSQCLSCNIRPNEPRVTVWKRKRSTGANVFGKYFREKRSLDFGFMAIQVDFSRYSDRFTL